MKPRVVNAVIRRICKLKFTEEIENNTLGARRYEISLRELMSERSEIVRCRVEHEKRNFISTSN